jgi:DNA-binding IclR family transcriptional regulator
VDAGQPVEPHRATQAGVELSGRERSELRVTDVSDELGVARSTAHRLLATLSHHGFVRQEAGSRSYRAGSVLVEIALAWSGRSDIRPLARPHLAQLAARLHETVNCSCWRATT